MKLIVKFNLVFIGVFLLGLVVAGRISYTLLQKNAQDEIMQNARIMMQAALAMRNYTGKQIKPLLETQMKYTFLPQTVPAYAATESFNDLRTKYPRIRLQGSHAQSDQSARPSQRLGSRHRQSVPQRHRHDRNHRRAGYPGRPFSLFGAPDSNQGPGLPAMPQHRRSGAQDDDREIRSGQRLRLEAERDDRRADRLGADRRALAACGKDFQASSWCRSPACLRLSSSC